MIKQQTLTFIRQEIQLALFVDVRTRGQLDFDGSMITRYGVRAKPRDEVTGQIIDRPPIRGTQSTGYKTSSCPLPPNAFQLTRLTKVVNMLPESQHALAMFAYSERCPWQAVEQVAKDLWVAFVAAQEKAFRAKKEKQLRGMVLLAMQNWKHQLETERDLHTPQRIRELLSINEHHWRRDWLPFWRQMHELLSVMDEKVLVNVHRSTRPAARTQSPVAVDKKQVKAA